MTTSPVYKKSAIVTIIVITALVSAVLTWAGLRWVGYHRPQAVDAAPGARIDPGDTVQLYTCGMHPWIITEAPGLCPICNMELTPKRESAAADSGTPATRRILYWRAPMDPAEIYDQPGKSAMGMDLTPVYEDEVISGVVVTIDPVVQQNMGVRTAPVEKAALVHTIRTYGHIAYDETRTTQISPKISGWFEKLYVDFTGEAVQKGQPLFEIYSPDLVAAQEEYLGAYRQFKRLGVGGDNLLQSARRRLQYFDVAQNEIDQIEAADRPHKTILIRSPVTGVVTHKNAVQGAFVKAGATVYQIADLSRVWVEAHIYEYELAQIKTGQPAWMQLPYLPGKRFNGQVTFVYPYLQRKTRDVVVRLEFENPDGLLKPDMYADVRIQTSGDQIGWVIPESAVIRSGERNLVFTKQDQGRFVPREITPGMVLDQGRLQVLSGLKAGEQVVTSGQFLLDSESKLQEAVQKMMAVKSSAAAPAPESDDFFNNMEPTSPDQNDDFFDDM